MVLCGSPRCNLRMTTGDTTPCNNRRTAPGKPTSTCVTRNSVLPLLRCSARSTSFTRTTLRPLMSMICWSIKSLRTASQPSFGRYASSARSLTFSLIVPGATEATWSYLATSG